MTPVKVVTRGDPESCLEAASQLTWEGRPIPILPGDTIASALTRAGIRTFRSSRHGAPRGLYCGIGVCYECVVEVEGVGTVRSCMTSASVGMCAGSPR